MKNDVLARVAALKTTPAPELRKLWRELFDRDAPPYNRRFLESRLAYRIQELVFGGLEPETVERLDALAAEFDNSPGRRRRSWTWSSTASTLSARLVRPTLPARSQRAGS
jgi:hypothetical protein